MTVSTRRTTRRRRAAAAAAVLGCALILSPALAGCETSVHGQDTRNGTQLRPSQVPTPPAYNEQVPPGQG